MGRRSLVAERRQQVLEAASRCLVKHGLAGSTLERIAEESGLSRSHIRHYVGNRDDLLLALVDWVQERDDRVFAASVAQAPPQERLSIALDYLFGPEFTSADDESTVIRELLRAGQENEALREAMLSGYQLIQSAIDQALATEFPHSTTAMRRSTAYGLLTLALGNSMMGGLDPRLSSGGLARVAGESLVARLGTTLRTG